MMLFCLLYATENIIKMDMTDMKVDHSRDIMMPEPDGYIIAIVASFLLVTYSIAIVCIFVSRYISPVSIPEFGHL